MEKELRRDIISISIDQNVQRLDTEYLASISAVTPYHIAVWHNHTEWIPSNVRTHRFRNLNVGETYNMTVYLQTEHQIR